jgi:hypothetical protein
MSLTFCTYISPVFSFTAMLLISSEKAPAANLTPVFMGRGDVRPSTLA